MQNSLIIIYRGVYFLIAIFFIGCFRFSPPPESNKILTNQVNVNNSLDSLQNTRLDNLEENLISAKLYLDNNSNQIKGMKDSLKAFHQLNISGDTSDKDIINSLIRIQTKLNIIEEKIFYSDSIYFNLLNDLVLIEDQIENLDKNLESVVDLNNIIDEKQNNNANQESTIELSFEDNYEIGREYYLKKEYQESLQIFSYLIDLDKSNVLSDNCQFWIGEIYYIEKNYNFAIVEYQKVIGLGDNNKTPYADYKIALCHVNLNQIDEAINQFQDIISKYPNEINLVSKSQKYIERYR